MEDEGNWIVSEIYDAPKKKSINQWGEDDRPRERLRDNGARTLSNAELLAILISSGNSEESAVDLMRRIMSDCGDSLKTLSQKSIEELMTYKGIGEAKAISILASCELGRRRQGEDQKTRIDLSDAKTVWKYMHSRIQDLTTEEGWIILLNNNFKLICEPINISHGGFTETAIDIRIVVKHALLNNATVIIMAHNHPSNNPRPSRDDDRLTKQIKEGLSLMRIHLADHIVLTDSDYYSYRENGKL